jgi:hypothetical protein
MKQAGTVDQNVAMAYSQTKKSHKNSEIFKIIDVYRYSRSH